MNSTDTLGLVINDIGRLIRAEFSNHPDTRRVTQASLRTIVQLSRMEGCRQVDLAAAVEIRPITLGRRLDRLESAGLIERVADPNDRRAQRLYLTPRSRARVERLRSSAALVYERAMRELTPLERETLMELLHKVRGALLEDHKSRVVARPRGAHA